MDGIDYSLLFIFIILLNIFLHFRIKEYFYINASHLIETTDEQSIIFLQYFLNAV